ncbi:hypothetical protein AAFF_G00087560 [Aldrovandia affinis]|uniref:Uncharacterized protein n=1 Tax=Aldrovandia affinis TaxID=143900 RepID=A0AAD7RWN4_9TELE|nr:hypothetical protein AAFF_G00087560 [Aldrovandia affinis]
MIHGANGTVLTGYGLSCHLGRMPPVQPEIDGCGPFFVLPRFKDGVPRMASDGNRLENNERDVRASRRRNGGDNDERGVRNSAREQGGPLGRETSTGGLCYAEIPGSPNNARGEGSGEQNTSPEIHI